jgi:MFS family permease
VRATWVRYIVLGGLCLITIVGYAQRTSIGVTVKVIQDDLGLSKEQMAWVISGFFAAYALLQIPTGWLAQVWGTRRALPFFALGSSLFTALMGLAPGYGILVGTRFMQGSAQAGFFPSATSTIRHWLPASQRALASGMLGSSMSVGAALGALITGGLLLVLSWQWIFVLYAIPGVLWAVWFALWFRNRPEEHARVNPAELEWIRFAGLTPEPTRAETPSPPSQGIVQAPSPEVRIEQEPHTWGVQELQGTKPNPLVVRVEAPGPPPTPWRQLFTSSTLGWICAQQFFRAAGYMFFGSWFAKYLSETRGVSVAEAGALTSLPLWGVVLGALVGGRVSDAILSWTGSRRLGRQGVGALALFLCAGCIVAAMPVAHPLLAVLLIALGSFLAAFAGPCAYAITIDIGGRHVAPVFATMNMCGNIGAFLFPLAVPPLVNLWNWQAVLVLFAGIYIAGGICWLMPNTEGSLFDEGDGD